MPRGPAPTHPVRRRLEHVPHDAERGAPLHDDRLAQGFAGSFERGRVPSRRCEDERSLGHLSRTPKRFG
jgi:hypothetical protein